MIDLENVAKILYETYCEGVGGVAFNGDKLPSWSEFKSDPKKKLQSDAWIETAKKAFSLFTRNT